MAVRGVTTFASGGGGGGTVPAFYIDPVTFGAKEDGSTNDTTPVNSAVASAGGLPATLVIRGPTLMSTFAFPINIQVLFVGNGMIKPANGATVQMNGPIIAGAWQIFDLSAGGSVIGTPSITECWMEWTGCNTAGTAANNDSTFDGIITFATAAGVIKILCLGGTYLFNAQHLVDNGQQIAPSIIGSQIKETKFSYTGIASGLGPIKYKGGSGASSGATIENITFIGNSTSIAITSSGLCGIRMKKCFFDSNQYGVKYWNELSGQFTEYDIVEDSVWRANCTTAIWWAVSAGSNSGHGSGLANRCQINASSTGPVFQIDSGILPYNAIVDCQVWTNNSATNLTIFSAANVATLGGFLTLEVASNGVTTLGTGSNIAFCGPVIVNGLTNNTGVSVVSGTFIRCTAAGIASNSTLAYMGAECNFQTALNSGPTTLPTNLAGINRDTFLDILGTNYRYSYRLNVCPNASAAAGVVLSTVGNTYEQFGWAATAPTTGATSGTLSTAWIYGTGTYTVLFANGEVRPVLLTRNATTATWTTALVIANSATQTIFQVLFPAPLSTTDTNPAVIGHPTFTVDTGGNLVMTCRGVALTFSPAPGTGATTGTLGSGFGLLSGTYEITFSTGQVITAAFLNGNTAVTSFSAAVTGSPTTAAFISRMPSSFTAYVYEKQVASGGQSGNHILF